MKKVKLIYNPFSGDKSFKFDLDVCIRIFQEAGYEVHIFRTIEKGDIESHIANMERDYDIVAVSGGDGTVNIVVNAIMKNNLKIPLGIIPSGTANDFGNFLGLKSNDIEYCCNIITKTKPLDIDLGSVNGRYFINVCGGGLLSNVSSHIDNDFKNALGKLAYYLKGAEQIPNFRPIPLKITNSNEVIEEELYLFLVLNSAGAGSFEKLSPKASITDGYFDFVGIKARPIYDLAVLFLKIIKGEHIGDPSVIYFKDNYVKVECKIDDKIFNETNIDGEAGPYMPIEIKLIPNTLPVFGCFK